MDLKAELEQLQTFRGEVERILSGLKESSGAPGRMDDHKLGGAVFGSNFDEVQAFYTVYNEVHGQLKTLSQLMQDQIEALQTAVLAAEVGYANVDEDLRKRLLEIEKRTREHYNPKLDPNKKAAEHAQQEAREAEKAKKAAKDGKKGSNPDNHEADLG
ncbi:hypothetical protein GCM10010218_18490 [Streptomyces mashuensis]|uniref:Uncharacterized protein n=1 Tax=Streptomyces mashuensis TaxID=33904 RepID=A0A919EAU8_9ACTN|nr:hypothetical protein [Streptomyces mashuensis]GHF37227.1 hypothetical protein GCM10010218_18490 [Streptomyces mashuensis]